MTILMKALHCNHKTVHGYKNHWNTTFINFKSISMISFTWSHCTSMTQISNCFLWINVKTINVRLSLFFFWQLGHPLTNFLGRFWAEKMIKKWKIYIPYYFFVVQLGRLYGRAKRTTKPSSELNSVGPETPKLMKFFWFRSLPVMTSSPLIRLQRPLPPSGDVILENENMTL